MILFTLLIVALALFASGAVWGFMLVRRQRPARPTPMQRALCDIISGDMRMNRMRESLDTWSLAKRTDSEI